MQGKRNRVQQTEGGNQSHKGKKERWGPVGSKVTLVPKKNYLRTGGRKSNDHSLHPH
jgi:hypothetical protein